MAKFIRKNRRKFAGIGLPLMALLMLGAIGLSVAPGWINQAYTTPGTPCSSTIGSIPVVGPCDVCNQETCFYTTTAGTVSVGVCANGSGNTNPDAPPTPACPGTSTNTFSQIVTTQPYCWNGCSSATILPGTATPVCQPNNDFCDALNDNSCRDATCLNVSTFDLANPTGCDYQALDESQNPECLLCEDNTEPPGYSTCGDGICEPGATPSEDCTSCPEDCLVPGFDDTCPANQTDLDLACPGTPAIQFVTFSGPPYNVPGSDFCEDGEVCTRNECQAQGINGVCVVTDISVDGCDAADEDFCCPSDCNPPVNGSCSGVTNCDLDCLTPQDCSEPIPSATPIVTGHNLEGSGISCSNSLIPDGNQSAMLATLLAVSAAIGVALSLRLRKH